MGMHEGLRPHQVHRRSGTMKKVFKEVQITMVQRLAGGKVRLEDEVLQDYCQAPGLLGTII